MVNMSCKVLNFFGSPGAGKSTTAAALFVLMKRSHYRCELVTEFAKDIVYRGDHRTLDHGQALIFGEQHHRIERASVVVDYVITDSPLVLSAVYGKNETQAFRDSCVEKFKSFDNLNFFLTLNIDNYKDYGRMQTSQESADLEERIIKILNENHIPYVHINNEHEAFSIVKAKQ